MENGTEQTSTAVVLSQLIVWMAATFRLKLLTLL